MRFLALTTALAAATAAFAQEALRFGVVTVDGDSTVSAGDVRTLTILRSQRPTDLPADSNPRLQLHPRALQARDSRLPYAGNKDEWRPHPVGRARPQRLRRGSEDPEEGRQDPGRGWRLRCRRTQLGSESFPAASCL